MVGHEDRLWMGKNGWTICLGERISGSSTVGGNPYGQAVIYISEKVSQCQRDK